MKDKFSNIKMKLFSAALIFVSLLWARKKYFDYAQNVKFFIKLDRRFNFPVAIQNLNIRKSYIVGENYFNCAHKLCVNCACAHSEADER